MRPSSSHHGRLTDREKPLNLPPSLPTKERWSSSLSLGIMFDGNRVDSDNLSAATCGQLYTAQAIPDVYGRNSHVYTTTNATYAGTTLYIHLITFYSLQIIRCIFLDIRYPSPTRGIAHGVWRNVSRVLLPWKLNRVGSEPCDHRRSRMTRRDPGWLLATPGSVVDSASPADNKHLTAETQS